MEPSAPGFNASFALWEAKFMIVLGAAIGGAVGALDGFTRGGKVHTLRGLILGMVFGMVGCTLGHTIGAALSLGIYGADALLGNKNFVVQVMARITAFLPIGTFLGAAIGASSLTVKRAVQGAIGGFLGAFISGSLFDLACVAFGNTILAARGAQAGEVGTPARAMTAVLLGALIGLFIGLVERFARSAWLKMVLGRNEGKEWSIDASPTFIGRSESAHVPLFGDQNVAPVHASIVQQGRQYILTDGGSPIGTYINGQRIQQAMLMHGMQIQIGSFQLYFLEKNQPAPARGPEAYRGQAFVPQPVAVPQGAAVPMASMPTQAFAAQPVPQQTSGYVLLALDGPLTGQRYPVPSPIDIGRESASVSLAFDSAASRRHATIAPSATGLTVNDLGSTNGTYVNGQRVSQANAAPGDMIKIGSTTFRVETN